MYEQLNYLYWTSFCFYLLLLFSPQVVSDSLWPQWTVARQAPLSSTISQCLLKFMSVESVMLSNHLILCHTLLLLPSVFPVSQLFTSGGQSIGASASALVLPMNIQGSSPLGGFPCGSAGKECACNVRDLGSIPGFGRFLWRRESLPTPVFWPREFHGLYGPWGWKESDTTEQLTLSRIIKGWI